MIFLEEMLTESSTVFIVGGDAQYENYHVEYYNIKESALVIIDERTSDDKALCKFRGRLYAGAFNPLERDNQDDFFKILDNLHIRCGDWSVLDRVELTDAGKEFLSSIPYLPHENVILGNNQ